jgi:hypothetical protein
MIGQWHALQLRRRQYQLSEKRVDRVLLQRQRMAKVFRHSLPISDLPGKSNTAPTLAGGGFARRARNHNAPFQLEKVYRRVTSVKSEMPTYSTSAIWRVTGSNGRRAWTLLELRTA